MAGRFQVETTGLQGAGMHVSALSQAEIGSALAGLSVAESAGTAAQHGGLAAGVSAFVAAWTQGLTTLQVSTGDLSETLTGSGYAYETADSRGPFSGAR